MVLHCALTPGLLRRIQRSESMPPHYRGGDGDFRNESMVSELVTKLGFDRVRELDIEAAMWVAKHRGH